MDVVQRDLDVGGGNLRVRVTGDPQGAPVLYFHGTPGSRLDLVFGDDLAVAAGVRLLSFDRPGYGGSSPRPFGLSSVARDALAVADQLGVGEFAALGLSGGGPFALATAALGGSRISRVGIASGAAPFQEVPGALESLSEIDTRAVALLPENPEEAAATFASGFEPFRELVGEDDDAIRAGFAPLLSPRDQQLMADPVIGSCLIASMRESLRQGVGGGGWDNVAWVGTWDTDVTTIAAPVLLWYGDEDLMAPRAHADWLDQHLRDAHLLVRSGEGHLGIFEHLSEMLAELVAA